MRVVSAQQLTAVRLVRDTVLWKERKYKFTIPVGDGTKAHRAL